MGKRTRKASIVEQLDGWMVVIPGNQTSKHTCALYAHFEVCQYKRNLKQRGIEDKVEVDWLPTSTIGRQAIDAIKLKKGR